MYYFWVTVFSVVMVLAWALTLFGFPGNWIMVGVAALFAYEFPAETLSGISWPVVGVLVAFALLGELLEFAAGASGMAKGGSKRGALLAIVGSFVGSLGGAFVGLPLPIIGSFVGVILFASLGAMVGALLGEVWKGNEIVKSFEIGKAAFWGRLFGALAKIIAGSIILGVAIAAAIIP
jgi:hypothetical protein